MKNLNEYLLTDTEKQDLINKLQQDIGWDDDYLVDEDESQYEIDLEPDLLDEVF